MPYSEEEGLDMRLVLGECFQNYVAAARTMYNVGQSESTILEWLYDESSRFSNVQLNGY
ncbi:hypothetical protein J6590_095719, partial [Homalodisca vitripennis]